MGCDRDARGNARNEVTHPTPTNVRFVRISTVASATLNDRLGSITDDPIRRNGVPTVQWLGYATGAAYVGIVANAVGFAEPAEPADTMPPLPFMTRTSPR